MITWENIQNFDDFVLDNCRRITEDLEIKSDIRCPHLQKIGKWFYYCSGGMPKEAEPKLEPSNPIYRARQMVTQLSMHCMTDYESCCCYKGDLPFP